MRFVVKRKCRLYLMQQSRERRNGQFTRVNPSVYAALDKYVMKRMDEILHSNPSKGKTIW